MPPFILNQDRRLAFLDSETTGLIPGHNEAIDWAVRLTEPDGVTVVREFTARVKPVHMDRFDPKAREVNGYTEEAWADAPPAKETAEKLCAITSGAILVAQNVAFDEGFASAFLKEEKFVPSWHYHKVCTMALAWPLIKSGKIKGLSLWNLAEWAGTTQTKPHSAMGDMLTMQTVYLALMKAYKDLGA